MIHQRQTLVGIEFRTQSDEAGRQLMGFGELCCLDQHA